MVAESVVPPASGHGIPSEVDLEAPEAVLKWMSTFGETYEVYGKKIVAAHYDSMHTLNFTEEELTELSIPKPHARRIVAAAQSVTAEMARVAGGAKSGNQANPSGGSYSDWEGVSVPAFPTQSGTDACGIGGMPSVSTMGAYFDRMAGAVRAVSAPLANAISAIKVNPEVDIESLRGQVAASDELKLSGFILEGMSADVTAFIGSDIIASGAALEMLQVMATPLFMSNETTTATDLASFLQFTPCVALHKVHDSLVEYDKALKDLKAASESVSSASKLSAMKSMVSNLKVARDSVNLWNDSTIAVDSIRIKLGDKAMLWANQHARNHRQAQPKASKQQANSAGLDDMSGTVAALAGCTPH